MSGIKALWLHQPYPTLIALGAKEWETRGAPPNGSMRPDGVRGMPGLAIEPGERVAIVAAQRSPYVDSARPAVGDYVVHLAPTQGADIFLLHRDGSGDRHPLPLGVVVCTAVVAEALPMVADAEDAPTCVVVGDDKLIWYPNESEFGTAISDQLPYGDWRPGRWAWRLTDVEQVPAGHEPNVVRGNRQGVCEIEVTW